MLVVAGGPGGGCGKPGNDTAAVIFPPYHQGCAGAVAGLSGGFLVFQNFRPARRADTAQSHLQHFRVNGALQPSGHVEAVPAAGVVGKGRHDNERLSWCGSRVVPTVAYKIEHQRDGNRREQTQPHHNQRQPQPGNMQVPDLHPAVGRGSFQRQCPGAGWSDHQSAWPGSGRYRQVLFRFFAKFRRLFRFLQPSGDRVMFRRIAGGQQQFVCLFRGKAQDFSATEHVFPVSWPGGYPFFPPEQGGPADLDAAGQLGVADARPLHVFSQ